MTKNKSPSDKKLSRWLNQLTKHFQREEVLHQEENGRATFEHHILIERCLAGSVTFGNLAAAERKVDLLTASATGRTSCLQPRKQEAGSHEAPSAIRGCFAGLLQDPEVV